MLIQNHFNSIHQLLESLINLFYPNLCVLCEFRTHSKEELFCMNCQYHVHPTGMYLYRDNEFTDHFQSRIDIVHGVALYYYVKGGRIQKAIELLKYKNRPEIGLRFGRFLGTLLHQIPEYQSIDLIVPVPLHPQKKLRRGYNQSHLFACGISDALKVGVDEFFLKRLFDTSSQTQHNRLERGINMQSAFELNCKDGRHKHILLVDDIMTTGATLEACGRVIQNHSDTRISMATIAIAT